MEFDRLCKEVERRFPEHRKAVDDSRLFLVETADWPTNKAKTPMAEWQPDEQVIENFRLPFETVAVEWFDSCVTFSTLNADKRKYAFAGSRTCGRSTNFFRGSIEAFPQGLIADRGRLGTMLRLDEFQVFSDGKEIDFCMSELQLDNSENGEVFTDGGCHVQWENSPRDEPLQSSGVRCKVDGKYINIEDPVEMRKAIPRLKEIVGELQWSIGTHVANMAYLELNAAVLCLLVICEPSRFIVEESLAEQKPYTGKQICRSPYRPHYIALKPGEIKKRYLYDEHDPNGIPKAPHERRGHFRKLTSEKYTTKRNQVVWVNPCWVGKTEGVRGKNRYMVMLDL